ncbi:MAG: hypothetical protein JOS17DRAFT_749005 [Linnemannia elongata]|nr:MAG: hypothetical protein JOS17DRAFT_749005 [Linnemannia elongata]
MKSTAILAIAASTVATVASAELLKYGAPIATTIWTAGQDGTISWTNDCSTLTTTSFPVMLQIQRADGVQIPVAGLASLGNLDCAKPGSLTVKVPTTVASGKLYSILVANAPDQSYSALFTIQNDAIPDPSANVTTTASGAPTATTSVLPTASVNGTASATTKPTVTVTTTPTPSTKPNNAGALKTGSAVALAVAGAVAALIF